MKWIEHLRKQHKANIDISNLKFNDYKSFLSWKEEEEFKCDSLYIQKSSSRLLGTIRTWYFYCNRAGNYVPRGRELRQMKSQGTSKVGGQCTAHIKAKRNEDNGHVDVTYCGTHSHPIRLSHIRIPNHIRMDIAAKLQQGVSMERILDDIRDSVTNKLGRKHLVTRQDLHNVKAQFNIDGIIRHKNDLTSVMAWVEEMSMLDYNPVLVFKPQGVGSSSTCIDDFLLVLQTQFQCDMLKQFGSNAVCIDSTHGTNAYHFNLTSILIVDDYGEGLPVEWMLSNREDKQMLIQFFRAIEQRVGSISPQWFMTDDAEQYHNAWKEVFGESNTRKILCAWHVDRAWRKALFQHVGERENQVHVYHQLRLLLTETEESQFRVILQEFLTYTEKYHYKFYNYFNIYYCKRVEQWASCYRKHTAVNTNMFVEAFHRILKMVYLHHKQNRRVDVLLVTLLRISRDKTFERLHKMETGKLTHRACEINKCHKAAELMQQNNQCQVTTVRTDKEWTVQSQSQQNIYYTIDPYRKS